MDNPKELVKKLSPKLRGKIVSRLRQVWRTSEAWSAVTKRCADPQDKRYSICEECNGRMYKKLLERDHVTPIGGILGGCQGDWNLFIDRLMFGELQGLCPECHKKRTDSQKEEAAEERAKEAAAKKAAKPPRPPKSPKQKKSKKTPKQTPQENEFPDFLQ